MSRTDPAPFPAVLIVEDDPTIGQHIQLGLQGHGYPTTWCRTGAAALIHVTEAKPRIVLLDLGLPDLDGGDCRLNGGLAESEIRKEPRLRWPARDAATN